jgi:hypothetical protein
LADQTSDTEVASPANGRTPPYISFQTFLTLLDELRTNGIPGQVDRSILRRFSGATGTQLLSALRALGVVDSDDRPLPALVSMVEADDGQFAALLRNLLRSAYPYVFKLDLMTATPAMFADAFRENTTAKEDVLRKCRTFFIHAAKKAEIPLGPRLQTGSGPRASSGGAKRKPKAARVRDDSAAKGGAAQGGNNNDTPAPNALMAALLEKFPAFDPNWPDDIKAKWFEGFDRFMNGAVK